MRTTILETYAMLVCLVCVICLIVLTSTGLYDIVQIVFPEFTIYGEGSGILERRHALKSLVKVLIVISVNIAAFSSHWIIGKRARKFRIS